MIRKNRLISLFCVLLILGSCETEGTSFYQGPYFQANQELELIINDGAFTYRKKFAENYSRDEYKLIKKFNSKNDSLKVYLKIDNRDTLVILPSSTRKVLFGNDAYRNPFVYTEKDTVMWLRE